MAGPPPPLGLGLGPAAAVRGQGPGPALFAGRDDAGFEQEGRLVSEEMHPLPLPLPLAPLVRVQQQQEFGAARAQQQEFGAARVQQQEFVVARAQQQEFGGARVQQQQQEFGVPSGPPPAAAPVHPPAPELPAYLVKYVGACACFRWPATFNPKTPSPGAEGFPGLNRVQPIIIITGMPFRVGGLNV